MNYITEEIVSCFKGIINPKTIDNKDYSIKYKIKVVLLLFIILLVLVTFSIFLRYILFHLRIIENVENIGLNNIETYQSQIMIFIYLCLYSPIIEELTYRLFLRFNSINLSISFGLIIFSISTIVFKTAIINLPSRYIISALIGILVGMVAFYFLRKKRIKEVFSTFWDKRFTFIFYLSVILFALAHIRNYNYNLNFLIFSPIILLPRLLNGYMFGYIRIKYGITWSIAIHFINNFLAFLFTR